VRGGVRLTELAGQRLGGSSQRGPAAGPPTRGLCALGCPTGAGFATQLHQHNRRLEGSGII